MQKIIFLVLFASLALLYGDGQLKVLDLSDSHYEIGESLLEYEDTTAKMTLSEIRHLSSEDFIPLNKPVASHPFTNSAFWYQFKVNNKENVPLSRVIIFEPAWLDSVNFTVISSEGEIKTYQGGNTYPYAKRALDHYLINFEHTFEPGISTVYLQVKTRDPFIVALSLMDKAAFLAEEIDASMYIGLVYGGIVAMLFYNLFLYFGTKARYYAYYVLFLGAFFAMNAFYNGYTFMYLFPNSPAVQNWGQSTSIYFYTVTALFFARSFLNFVKYHHTLYITTRYLIVGIVVVAVLTAVTSGYHYHVMLAIISLLLVSIYLFGIALYSLVTGNRSARFFLLGTASGLIGASITALTIMSYIPYTYLTYKAIDFGLYIDVVLLSMALADRMKMTQEKKLIAEKEAKTDILTGLYNRRAYYEISHKEFQRLIRHNRCLSIIMFDIDHFKEINDTYGHDAGDNVLKCVASIVKGVIREYDYAFRMGGDEFLVLLPETNEKQALFLAERIRKRVANKRFIEKDEKFFITASFGISQYNHIERSIVSIVKRADKALYYVKESGRNNVKVLDRFMRV
ncbi:sensor domain-containing diguanylate cyclase [Sulfurovum sp. XGS-02]|uniref:sensor domain-containing diguanylate cyclase n=1 Tax=Sulfurovum sp. XGS-02 TaxID=2925411 RepID=UPI00204D5DCA|nr:diguanylate cyclase [Sulfurovum sp. XGS-02]UPT76722.1 sensor domain-containing diguanylate cyclase [Sulfurovum sp. XGS-02]